MRKVSLFIFSVFLGISISPAQAETGALKSLLSENGITTVAEMSEITPALDGYLIEEADTAAVTRKATVNSLADRSWALHGLFDEIITALHNSRIAPIQEAGVWSVKFNQSYDNFFYTLDRLEQEALRQHTPKAENFSSYSKVVGGTARGAINVADKYSIAFAIGADDAAYKKIQRDANVKMVHQMIDGLVIVAKEMNQNKK